MGYDQFCTLDWIFPQIPGGMLGNRDKNGIWIVHYSKKGNIVPLFYWRWCKKVPEQSKRTLKVLEKIFNKKFITK